MEEDNKKLESSSGSRSGTSKNSSDNGDILIQRHISAMNDRHCPMLSKSPSLKRDANGVIGIEMNNMSDEETGFYVRWNDLNYTVKTAKIQKQIINNLNGFFLSGELVAVMGPSGAGKTTLLDCLCMKNREGLTGDIIVVGKPKIRIALVPQKDDFLPQFTVTETVFYASRYKNRTYDISHGGIVRRVIQQLGLEACQNVRVSRCSGGQRKRVAIAQELVKKPNILMLDEPTSGLDSSSCYQTVEVLRRIINASASSTPLCIVTTIHQPSSKVVSLFDRVYLMASPGRLAFNGAPDEIVPALAQAGSACPAFYNPVDHMIEVVSGDYGSDKVESLIALEHSKQIQFDTKLEAVTAQPLKKAILHDPCPFDDHIWIHFQRSTIQLMRDPIMFSVRILIHLVMPFFFAYLWGLEAGKGDACPSFNKQTMSIISTAVSQNLTKEEKLDLERVNDNLIYSIYGGVFTMYAAGMITVLSFPLDVKVLAREYFNGWYTVTTYLIGKITSDAPFQMLCVLLFASISYYISNQPQSDYHWRFAVYVYSLICLSLLAQTQGLIVGTVFMQNLSASVFVGPLTITPIFLFSGYARRYSRMANYLKPLVKLSYFHHAIKTVYSALYGFGRCKCNPSDYQLDLEDIEYEDIDSIHIQSIHSTISSNSNNNLAGTTHQKDVYIGKFKCDETFRSLVMDELDIEDSDMYYGMIVLFSYLVLLRGVVLILLMYKVRR